MEPNPITTKTQKPTNPVVFTIIIPWNKVSQAYQKQLAKITAAAEIKGFRKGKAPAKLVEEKIGKSKIYSDLIQDLLPTAFQEEVKKRNLISIISPRVKPLKLDENKDWEFEITVVIKPKVELGDYQEEIKKAVKDKSEELKKIKHSNTEALKKTENTEELNKNQKMTVAFDTLLKTVKIDLPPILIDEEVNFRLSKLIDQITSLGMTIEQYLQAKKITREQLRTEYTKTAADTLKLNFALDAVANRLKFTEKDRIARAVDSLLEIE